MTVCFVGNFDKASPGEGEVAAALEGFGHTVLRVREDRALTICMLRELLASQPVDLLLFSKFRLGTPMNARGDFLAGLSIPKICWLFDLYWGLHNDELD